MTKINGISSEKDASGILKSGNNGTVTTNTGNSSSKISSASGEKEENGYVETNFSDSNAYNSAQTMYQIGLIEAEIRKLNEEKSELTRKMRKAESDDRRKYRKQIRKIDDSITSYRNKISYLTNQMAYSTMMSLSMASMSEICSSTNTTTPGASIKDGSFNSMIPYILQYEGGYSNDPDDPGGATNYGITQNTYNGYCKQNGLKTKSVKYLTVDEAKEVYYKNFYVASGAAEIAKTNPNLAFAVFDAAVNHGVGWAKSALSKCGGNVDSFMEIRKQYYKSIVARNPKMGKFAKGWQNRWNNVYSVINPNHKYENYI